MSSAYDTVEWKCFFCKAAGRGLRNNERHLNRHFWEWVRQETADAQRASGLWVCRLGIPVYGKDSHQVRDDNGELVYKSCRACRSERAFRGHMWHEHAADWMEAWSCWQDVDVSEVV